MEASSQDFQPITPPRSRSVSGIGWILAFIWNILAFIRTWYNNPTSLILKDTIKMASSRIKPANRAAEVVLAFSELLTAETLHYMTQLPKFESLTSDEVDVLQQIANHFSGRVDIDAAVTNSDTPMADALPLRLIENDEPVTVDDDTIQEDTSLQIEPSAVGETSLTASHSVGRRMLVPSTRRRDRPRVSDAPHKSNASSKQWGTVLAKETFQLDASLQRHAQNVDPTLFVGDIRRGFSITNRITREGYAYEDAMAELKELPLAETAEESVANEMSDAIRNYLRQVYRVDEIGFGRVEEKT